MMAACETSCVKECCGLDAYDFSPLNLAAHLSKYHREIKQSILNKTKQDLDSLLESAKKINSEPEEEFTFEIEEMNEYFNFAKLKKLIEIIKMNIDLTPQILELSKSLEHPQKL